MSHAQNHMYFRATLASDAFMSAEYKQDPSAFFAHRRYKPLLRVHLVGGIICCGQASNQCCCPFHWLAKGALLSMAIDALMSVP